MKTKIFSAIACISILLLAGRVVAQNGFVLLQHEGQVSLFRTIAPALAAAASNDTIYIPGSAYNEHIILNKKLMIYGTGHYADSTQATGMTRVYGNLTFQNGSEGSKIEGIRLEGDVNTSYSHVVKSISISRCKVNNVSLGDVAANSSGIHLSEMVITGNIQGSGNLTNFLVEKSVIQGVFHYFSNITRVEHCVLLSNGCSNCTGGHSSNFYSCTGVDVFSNVIVGTYVNYPNTCLFKNNLIVGNPTLTSPNAGNIISQAISSIFMNVPDDSKYVFNYTNDYHLAAGSPGIGAGEDGTDIGIYGSTVPYKTAAVPSTPHIYRFEVAKENDSAGKLNVKVGVAAQDR